MPTYIIVTPFFPTPKDWSGAYCHDFAVALQKNSGYKVVVFKSGSDGDYIINGISVYSFKIKVLPSNAFPFLFRKKNEASFLQKVLSVGIKIDDVVFCHGHTAMFAIYPLAIKRLNPDCRTLLHHHDLASFGLNQGILRNLWLYNMFLFPALRKLHEQIDYHIFISELARRSFLSAPDATWSVYTAYRRQMWGLPYKPVHIRNSIVLYNGVNTRMFSSKGNCVSQKRTTTPSIIGCIGNFTDLKDQLTLLKAAKLLKDNGVEIHLILIGTGPCRNMCERYAKANGIYAEFRCEVEHEKMPSFYRSLDLFVLPSYFEGFGCVFAESLSCGVPFITCKGQGIAEVLCEEDADRWLCDPKDYKGLAVKINDYLNNRWEQHFNRSIEINKLVREFVKHITESGMELC